MSDILGKLGSAGPAEMLTKRMLNSLSLFISGLEVTQAIQYHRADAHLTDAKDRRADNSLRLVAFKPIWVRVYLRSLNGVPGVTGTLRVQRRRRDGSGWNDAVTLSPRPPWKANAVWDPGYVTERRNIRATLNFVVPAIEASGVLRLIAEVEGDGRRDTWTEEVVVTHWQTLRLAGVMVAYDGPTSAAPNAPNLQVAAPGVTELATTSALAHTLFPVASSGEYRHAGSVTLTQVLSGDTDAAGGCTPGWYALIGLVASRRVQDGNRPGWAYYGLVPAGVPVGNNTGCAVNGTAAGFVGDGMALAHELGHACGLRHAPCGAVGTGDKLDAGYPTYEPYPPASIGEWGLDVNDGRLSDPNLTRDFMSYCGAQWISVRNWLALFDQPLLNPASIGTGRPWWWNPGDWQHIPDFPEVPIPGPEPWREFTPLARRAAPMAEYVSLIGVRDAGGRVEVRHVARTRLHPDLPAEPTALRARLLDRRGEELAAAPVLRFHASGGCGCEGGHGGDDQPGAFLFQALIPASAEPGVRLEIREGEATLWGRDAPADGPVRVGRLAAEPDRDGGMIHCRWSLSRAAEEVWLRWSDDGGESWRALASGLTGETACVPRGPLPGGRVLLQAVAHDGFHSQESEPVEVTLPARPPEVAILYPRAGQVLVPGATLRLWGAAPGMTADAAFAGGLLWRLDDREIGLGPEVWTEAPNEAGEHILELHARNAEGAALSRLIFRVASDLD